MDDMTTAEESTDESQSQRIEKIISKGKRARPGGWLTLLLALLSGGLLWTAFTPLDIGPLGWICLVPLLLLTRIEHRTHWMYRNVYLAGLLFWLITLQWMRLGDPSMYVALLLLSLYLACYWPLFLALTRTAVSRLGAPLFVAAPVMWVGLEYLRAYLVTGFSWYYIGHTQHNWIEIIQISDLVGAYGVSFLVVMANAAIVQVIPLKWIHQLKLQWADEQTDTVDASAASRVRCVAISLAVVLFALGYGFLRRHQSEFQVGPRVSLIQGNFVASLKPDTDQWGEIYRTHHYLTGLTVPYQPDLIIWPEAMFRYPMMVVDESMSDEALDNLHPMIRAEDWKNSGTQEKLSEIADKTDSALIIGVNVYEATPAGDFSYNSAAFVEPQQGVLKRYDKIHRVLIGEYIPFREQLPFIQSFTPFRGDFGIDAGKTIQVFEHEDWRLLPTICFEDTVPHLVRSMVNSASNGEQKQIDVIVNLTNDGWFHGSSELDQHLITSSFRAVETRTPLVRAVNTGISALIDGDGVIREPDHFIDLDAQLADESPRTSMRDPKTGTFHRQLNCALVADVPLDDRTSFYVRYGDWFAAICLVACVAVAIQSFTQRSRTTPSS